MENRKEIQLSVRNLAVKMGSENKSYGGIGKIKSVDCSNHY